MTGYVGLHQHSTYSLLDGFCKIPDLVRKSKELGWTATAITDHNHLGGIPDFQQECFKQGIKPILGMEGYFTVSTKILSAPIEERHKIAERDAILSGKWTEADIKSLDKQDRKQLWQDYGYDTSGFHILFLAKNQQGWNNLVKIQSESSKACTFNGRYHCDMNILRKYHDGIICTTACVANFAAAMINNRKTSLAAWYLSQMQKIFSDDFYLEIQPLNIKKQQTVNLFYHTWAQDHSVKVIATNDSHWINQSDAADHDVLLCIGTGAKQADMARMHYSPVFWVRSEEEMISAFEEQANSMVEKFSKFKEQDREDYLSFCKQALTATKEIADKVDPDIKLGSEYHLFPAVKVEEGKTAEFVLYEKAATGLFEYLYDNPDLDREVYKTRFAEELDIICSKGFAPYFLAFEELATWCDINDIPTGPGRGSAAGSLTLLCLGVTKKIDPIKMKLWFSRFMTKDRTAIPDIDYDVSWAQRDKVIKHLKETYGTKFVAHIGTFTTLKVKSAIKDVARVLGLEFTESLKISKAIDALSEDPNLSFKTIDSWADGSLDDRERYKRFQELESSYEDIFELARKFEGIPRQMGVHASGILVMPKPVSDLFPVRYLDGVAVTLWTGTQVDEMKACKLDLLGLKTLDLLDTTVKNVGLSIRDIYETVDINDKELYKAIREKKTNAVFQLESNLMKQIIDTIQPTCFDDVIAINALARPGPLSCNMHVDYAAVKNGEKEIQYPIRGCDDILDITYGAIVYQEQVMAISKRIAGFDDNQADNISRKIIGKKIAKLWPMLVRCHTYGKKNCEGPDGWEDNDNLPWYDPKGKYGDEIEGAINRGYSSDEVISFFNSIENYASYAFNRSHAACYSLLGIYTMYVKLHYPVYFWASVLSIAEDAKKEKYFVTIKEQDIQFAVPDINKSNKDFTADSKGKKIFFGLNSVKGIGESTVADILSDREKNGFYKGVEDINSRLPKKTLRLNVFLTLVLAGAFAFEDENRFVLYNKVLDIRKDKKTKRKNVNKWNEDECKKLEKDLLGARITYSSWWDSIKNGSSFKDIKVNSVTAISERTDKKGRLMLFCNLTIDACKIKAIMFASDYANHNGQALKDKKGPFVIAGKRQDDTILIKNVKIDIEEILE